MTEHMHYLSASEALRRFRARQLSPVELLDAIIARTEAVEPVVNAFAERMFESAVHAAREAEKRYGQKGAPPRPLEGLPIAAKEAEPITGHAMTAGSLIGGDAIATETSAVLTRIVAAGGILHARTTTSEFCCMPASHTRRWGVTRNPWNPAASAAGSSGGSAASLAAGTSMLATGSDIGGSLRAPASVNGIVSFKPPHGRNPIPRPEGLDPYLHVGPMARTVTDCALLQNVMVGPHPRDASSLHPALAIPEGAQDVYGLRVAFCDSPGDFPVAEEVRANTRATALALRSAGATIDEIEIDWRLSDIKQAMWAHFGDAGAQQILALAKDRADALTPYTLAFAEKSVDTAQSISLEQGRQLEVEIYAELATILERYDALIVPTVGTIAFAAGEDYVDTRLVVDGVELEHFSDASLTPVFNICNTCPVLAIPSGWASNGVPTGVQVVARPYDDPMAFRVALAIEQVRRADFADGQIPRLS